MTRFMRDGSTVVDSRLGRLREWDDRNRDHPVRALFGDSLPALRSYTWRVGLHLDQGHSSACVGHGFAHELAARPQVVTGLTHADAMMFYDRAQDLDQWAGKEPEVEGTSVLAGAKVMVEQGWYTGYRWALTEPEIAAAVGHVGPVVVGTDWHQDMFRADDAGFIHPTGAVVGGHCYLIYRLDLRAGCYWIWNSWGAGWAINGTARITRADLGLLLATDGEACLPVRSARVR